VQWLRDGLQAIEASTAVQSLAESVPDSGGVIFVPAFTGLGAPWWRPDARGAILGLTPAASRAHIVRAALEAIAYLVRDALADMRAASGMELGVIHADGGAARNRFLMQFTADITRLRVQAALNPELSALGAAQAGLLGLGVYRSLDELAALPGERLEYAPVMPAARAEELLAGWRQAVARVLADV